jgi:hypothetical protein
MSIRKGKQERSVQELIQSRLLRELVLLCVVGVLAILMRITTGCMEAVDRALRKRELRFDVDDEPEECKCTMFSGGLGEPGGRSGTTKTSVTGDEIFSQRRVD